MPSARSAALRGLLRLAAIVSLIAAGPLLSGCDGGGTDEDAFGDDLVGRFESRDRYVPLAEALTTAGLAETLRSGGPYTVLAPTRIAFTYVGTDFSPVLFAEPQREVLARVLRHHVLPGRLAPGDFADGATLTAIDGTTLRVRRFGPVVTVNGVTVDLDDPTEGSNGVAYPLADVLFDVLTGAERVRLSPLLSTFSLTTRNTGVLAQADALDRVTVLAPINDAFTALGSEGSALLATANADVLSRALRAHVLPGDVDLAARAGQTVTTLGGDPLPVAFENGVLTVAGIRVLHQEATADGRLYILGEPVLSVLSLAERLRIRPTLSRYTADVAATPAVQGRLQDRAEALTVFAPTDFAYSQRYEPLSLALLEPENAALRRRLTAVHVVPGRYRPEDLVDGLTLTALDGTVLQVERTGTTIRIDGRVLSGTPSEAINGLLYGFEAFAFPDVDLFDTLLLREYVEYVTAVRRAGLEPAFRTTVRTAFALQDALLDPTFISRPDLVLLLRRTATTEFIPDLAALSLPHLFTALDGSERAIEPVDCSLNPADSACSPFALASRPKAAPGVQVYPGAETWNGSAVVHTLRSVDEPPSALRAGR